MTNSNPSLFSAEEALRYGWEKATASWRYLVTIAAVGLVLSLLNPNAGAHGAGAAVHGGRALLSLVVQVLQCGVALALVRSALKVVDGRPLGALAVGPLLEGFWDYLLTSVLYGLVVAAGMVLLVVPGVLWAVRYGFAPFAVVDRRCTPREALRVSARLTEGRRGPLFVFGLVLVGVNLLGALALGVGLLISIPTTMIAAAYVYRRLEGREPVGAGLAAPAPTSPATRDAPPHRPAGPATPPLPQP